MALYGHNFDVFVGTYVDGTGSNTAADLTDNQFGVEDMSTGLLIASGSPISGSVSSDFRVVKKNEDGSLRYSPVVNFNNIYKGSGVEGNGTAATGNVDDQQIELIGYHGSGSDSIRVVNSNRYTIRLNFVNDGELYSRQKDQYFFEYVSDADAKGIEIANYFAQNMSSMEYLADASTVGAKRAKISVERFIDASTEGSVTNDVTFTRGSKIAKCGSASHGILVGEYIRKATGVASPVYKVVSLPTTTTIELDQVYQGTSGAAGSGNAKRVSAANAEAASAGLKITGLETFHKVGLYPQSVVEFNVTLDGFGATELETSQKAKKGSNDGRAIADMEWFSLGRNTQGGASFTGTGFPSAQSYATLDADSTAVYDVITLDYFLDNDVQYHAIAPGGKIRGSIVFALVDAVDHAQDHLEDLFANVDGISGSAVSQSA